jgi:hypothetical protein
MQIGTMKSHVFNFENNLDFEDNLKQSLKF